MRSMKDSGITWVGMCPSNWRIMANKYLMYKIKHINAVHKGEDILSLSTNGVVVRDLEAGGKMPTSFDGYQILYPGNLLMCLFDYDVTPRCIGLIRNHGVCSPAYSQFVMKEDNYAPYYYYYYLMIDHTKELLHLAKNLRHSFTEDQLGAINAPVPPVQEQKAIAHYLDIKCKEIDTLLRDIQTQISVLEQYKQSLITEVVMHGLEKNVEMAESGFEWVSSIPNHWEMKKGKYLFAQRSQRGNSIALQLLSPTQKYGVIPQTVYEDLSGMSAVKLNEQIDLMQLKTIHTGDFCISLRSFQGGFEYSEYEGVVSPAYQVFYPTVNVASGYYKYLFKERSFIEKMNSFTMNLRDGKNIAFSDFGNTYIPVPPIEEQEAISIYLDKKCKEIDGIIAAKSKQYDTIEDYKKSTIYEYVTGKKEVPA